MTAAYGNERKGSRQMRQNQGSYRYPSDYRRSRVSDSRTGDDEKKEQLQKEANERLMNSLVFENLSQELDRVTADVGRTIGELFKAVSLAAVRLPKMKLKSDLIDVTVDGNSITVHIDGLFEAKKHEDRYTCYDWPREYHSHSSDRGYEEEDWYLDDEEERLYDGD